jgi:glycyl-tRNA synthetase
VVLSFAPSIAPITVAFMPLAKKLSEPVEKLYKKVRAAGFTAQVDESGSIGKRYRRQDEIGTPFCVTYDFDSEQDHCITVRDRDTTKQERIPAERLVEYLNDQMKKERTE